ncbi:L,D-transpeptidase family protein [Lacrimispora sp. 210928-DFI.3.58]|uniref:L,D-transpeptidase family protein n=1 Tax=Lacrimispora sp. 210928-DFI.3.58 TaxID=2883214 RepID=UPI001D08AEFE|nr:L,D-transpeptidase family protein [Lacrimispora sp. 210928-DFI.3.58]MCB7320615.1 hypothetical protein [Lacrimispora sp. 210928-DFI.3.58]
MEQIGADSSSDRLYVCSEKAQDRRERYNEETEMKGYFSRVRKTLSVIALAGILSAGGWMAMTSQAAGHRALEKPEDGGPGAGEAGVFSQEERSLPSRLETATETDQLIAVVGTGGYKADILYYRKDENGWQPVWKEQGYVGRSGITAEKAEGDGATPAGVYGFHLAFGLKEDPGSLLPYHQIVEGDFWVDDPESSHYNRLVNTASAAQDWKSAENLIAAVPYYDYGLSLDYNIEGVPGKGSAIFLHCFKEIPDQPSSGCVCLPEGRVKELLCSVTESTRIAIFADWESAGQTSR